MPVWYSSITKEQSKSIEKIQRYAVSIILNNWSWSYEVKCTLLQIEPLFYRRNNIALSFSIRSAKNPKHADLFKKKSFHYNTRENDKIQYEEELTRSKRFYNSPLVSLIRDLNKHNLKLKHRETRH